MRTFGRPRSRSRIGPNNKTELKAILCGVVSVLSSRKIYLIALFYEKNNENCNFITGGKLFVYIRDCQFLKEDFIPSSLYNIRDCTHTHTHTHTHTQFVVVYCKHSKRMY